MLGLGDVTSTRSPTAQIQITSHYDLAIDRGVRRLAFSPPVGLEYLSVPSHAAHLPVCPLYSAIERPRRGIQSSDRNDRHIHREVDTDRYRGLMVTRDI